MSEEAIGAAALTCRYVLALVLLTAAIPKLGNRRELERAIANYKLLRPWLVPTAAVWLPRVELACGLALLGGVAVPVFAGAAALLLALFSLAIAVNLVRGREIDCGCAGSVVPRRVGWGLVAGDLLLAAAAVFVATRDPEVLSVVPFWQPGTALEGGDGVAIFVVAVALVLGRLVLVSAGEVRRAERSVRSLMELSR